MQCIGAIIGDMVGSICERNPIRTKDFPFFQRDRHFTCDMVMTLAVYRALKAYDRDCDQAHAVAAAIYLAKTGADKEEIRAYIDSNFYDMNFTLAEIWPDYKFDATCPGSVPQAIMCFLEGESFEDVVRNCVWLGGDCDTTAAIAGGIAAAYYGVEEWMVEEMRERLGEGIIHK